MTTPSGGSPEDEFWRRPTPDQPDPKDGRLAEGAASGTDARPAGDATPTGGAGSAADRTGEPGNGADGAPATAEADSPWARPDRRDDGQSVDWGTAPEQGGGPVPDAGQGGDWAAPGQAESAWARPAADAAGGGHPAGAAGWSSGTAAPGGYAGPPPTTPPPPGWRPPVYVQPPPPRRLAAQDMAALDQAERQAQRLTYGFGTVAAVVLVLLMCLFCSRVIF